MLDSLSLRIDLLVSMPTDAELEMLSINPNKTNTESQNISKNVQNKTTKRFSWMLRRPIFLDLFFIYMYIDKSQLGHQFKACSKDLQDVEKKVKSIPRHK